MTSKFMPRIGMKTVAKQGYSSVLRNSFPAPSQSFPNAIATVDAQPGSGNYYGGPQTLGNIFSNGGGNLMRQYISQLTPNYCEQSDGSIKTFNTSSAIRPVLGGMRNNWSHTNIVLSPRDLTNAAWIRDAGVSAAKNQTGRTGVANSASSLTWTVDNAVCAQDITSTSSVRTQYVDAKRLSGSDPLEWSMDGTNYFNVPLDKPRYLGIGRYKLYNAVAFADPKVRFRSKAGNSFLIDFVNNDNSNNVEGDVNGSNVRAWEDRLSCQSVDNSPFYAVSTQAVQTWFLEYWQRKDDGSVGLFRSDGHMSLSSSTGLGVRDFGCPSAGIPRIAPDDGLFDPAYMNRVMFWRTADGKSFLCLNGGDPVQGTLALQGGQTHFDIITNGAGTTRADGAWSRFWAGITTPTTAYAKAMTAVT